MANIDRLLYQYRKDLRNSPKPAFIIDDPKLS